MRKESKKKTPGPHSPPPLDFLLGFALVEPNQKPDCGIAHTSQSSRVVSGRGEKLRNVHGDTWEIAGKGGKTKSLAACATMRHLVDIKRRCQVGSCIYDCQGLSWEYTLGTLHIDVF